MEAPPWSLVQQMGDDISLRMNNCDLDKISYDLHTFRKDRHRTRRSTRPGHRWPGARESGCHWHRNTDTSQNKPRNLTNTQYIKYQCVSSYRRSWDTWCCTRPRPPLWCTMRWRAPSRRRSRGSGRGRGDGAAFCFVCLGDAGAQRRVLSRDSIRQDKVWVSWLHIDILLFNLHISTVLQYIYLALAKHWIISP